MLENTFSKDEILEYYLNIIYFGETYEFAQSHTYTAKNNYE